MQLRLYVYTRAHAVSVNDVTVLLFESLSLLFSFFLFLTGTSSASFRFEKCKWSFFDALDDGRGVCFWRDCYVAKSDRGNWNVYIYVIISDAWWNFIEIEATLVRFSVNRERFVVESFESWCLNAIMEILCNGWNLRRSRFFPRNAGATGVPVFRQARENFTSNSKQRGQYLLCSK